MGEGSISFIWICAQLLLLAVAVGLQCKRVWGLSERGHSRVLRSYYDDNRDFRLIALGWVALVVLDIGVVAARGLFGSGSFKFVFLQILICPLFAVAVISIFEGAVKRQVEPPFHLASVFRRDEKPVRYWLLMAWKGFTCVVVALLLVVMIGVSE